MIIFGWSVPARRYQWVQATGATEDFSRPQPALVEMDAAAAGAATEGQIRPEPCPALFRAFAELDPANKRNILAFAARYGDLGVGTEVKPTLRTGSGLTQPSHGTFLVTWRHQIADMQLLVGLWDLLRRDDREGLAAHIQWREEGANGPAVFFVNRPKPAKGAQAALGSKPVDEVIASQDAKPEWLPEFTERDPLLPAWRYLEREIDDHLHHTNDQSEPAMGWDARRARPVRQAVCHTLLSAVWLQFADAVSNDSTFSKCRECGKWFEIAPDAARSHRRFCSNSCRSKAYRGRQDKARQLFVQKMTFEEIAEELDSDVPTVRRWITGSKD
ncbi:MAG: hypothetical protein FJ271_30380 [Planctomycetes bacterium]|nr:hypothetical protein [Planctomycetota bacterium]